MDPETHVANANSPPSAKYEALAREGAPCLKPYLSTLRHAAKITDLRARAARDLSHPKYRAITDALDAFPLRANARSILDQPTVAIGSAADLSATQTAAFMRLLAAFVPWKKGPFSLFGIDIDAEWRADLKWQRIEPFAGPLEGKRVADIGCNNGYYMLRMAPYKPEIVVGFEPYGKYWYNFHMLQTLAAQTALGFELLGVEHIHLFERFFDVIFCLGILYHHTDPVGILTKMRRALSHGGKVIIDCQGISGEGSMALVPRRRYAGARGVWFLPTYACLESWLLRADFKVITPIYAGTLTSFEQRATKWAPIASLGDFLDPADPSLTIGGYPAPQRFYVMAR